MDKFVILCEFNNLTAKMYGMKNFAIFSKGWECLMLNQKFNQKKKDFFKKKLEDRLIINCKKCR